MEKNIFKLLEELHRQSLTTDVVPITQFRKQPSESPLKATSEGVSNQLTQDVAAAVNDMSLRKIIQTHAAPCRG